jgi:hypothetical protein
MKPFIPHLTTLKSRKALSVTSYGDPNKVAEPFFKALYGAAYYAKMKIYKPKGVKMDLGPLTAEWPDAHLVPKNQWKGIWYLPVPDYFKEADLVQKDPNIMVSLATLPAGEYAEILHIGGYAEEEPSIKLLHRFIEDSGTKMQDVIGTHEEEYLTSPKAKVQKTVIRYLLKKQK